MNTLPLSLRRLWAMVRKEFIQMRRDRLTFAMMVGIPVIQLAIFGFAINTDPKRLPTAAVVQDGSEFARSLVAAVEATGYFRIVATAEPVRAAQMLERGDVQFVLTIPVDFSRRLVRGEMPAVLLEADASDPAATSNALAALEPLARGALRHELIGPLASRAGASTPFEWRVHRLYNPEGITQYNIVPGLMGVILTMTMIIMTALGMTRELERGTMENLLAMPVRPLEVIVGKILPYVLVGYIQVVVILLAAYYVFEVPMVGSVVWLALCVLVFIVANLTVGITFSSLARNQTQAMQMSFFFFLPSILLSGFMFPFRGMPGWAQVIGEALPLTHFLRLVRGILLKGYGVLDSWPHLWPLLLFTAVVLGIGLKRFRKTLD